MQGAERVKGFSRFQLDFQKIEREFSRLAVPTKKHKKCFVNRRHIEREFFKLAQRSRHKDRFSNNFLWHLANFGDKDALTILYNKTRHLWFRFVPGETSLYNKDDWFQIAAEEFFQKWMRFDPDKGFAFNSWIVRVIRNRWLNVLRGDEKRTPVTVSETVFKNFEDMLTVEFVDYEDGEFMDAFLYRFRDYLISENVSPSVLHVFDLRIHAFNISIDSIASVMQRSVSFVKRAHSQIRECAHCFGKREKELKYDCKVFC